MLVEPDELGVLREIVDVLELRLPVRRAHNPADVGPQDPVLTRRVEICRLV